jgi:hypothetical protein
MALWNDLSYCTDESNKLLRLRPRRLGSPQEE